MHGVGSDSESEVCNPMKPYEMCFCMKVKKFACGGDMASGWKLKLVTKNSTKYKPTASICQARNFQEFAAIGVEEDNFVRKTSLTEDTTHLLSQFDKMVTKFQKYLKEAELEQSVKGKILVCTSPDNIMESIENAHNIDEIFLWLSITTNWLDFDLLEQLFKQLGDAKCKEMLFTYKTDLKQYFHKRAQPVTAIECGANNNHLRKNNRETYVFEVDDAWNRELLRGESCVKTCRHIGSILGKCGGIEGCFHDPYLYIHLPRAKIMEE